jgi:predicted RNase H-like HicB family nuclease
MSVYHVVVTQEGAVWAADVPSLPGTHTWGRGLATLERHVREAIALMADLPQGAEKDLMLTWEYRTGDDSLDAMASTVREAQARLTEDEKSVSDRTAELVSVLAQRGWSARNIAHLANVPVHQVSRLAPTPRTSTHDVGEPLTSDHTRGRSA